FHLSRWPPRVYYEFGRQCADICRRGHAEGFEHHAGWHRPRRDRVVRAIISNKLSPFVWAGFVLTSFPRAMLIMAAAFGLWRGRLVSNALFAGGGGAGVLVLRGG